MGTLTKAKIASAVHDSGIADSAAEATQFVETFLGVLKDSLVNSRKLKIVGFGTFTVRDKSARNGRNPQTGEPIKIAARRVLNFKASEQLKAKMNPESSQPE